MNKISQTGLVRHPFVWYTAAALLAVVFYQHYYVYVPPGITEPRKYFILSLLASVFDKLFRPFENLSIVYSVRFSRFMYWFSIAFPRVRNPSDGILITSTEIERIPVQIYRPLNLVKNDEPSIIFFHGGGFFLGDIATYDNFAYTLANLTKSVVFSVDYPLSPENKFPVALNASLKVTNFIFNNWKTFSINPKRIALCGDSAGGNLVAVITNKLRTKPKLLVLIYPLLQMVDFTSSSYKTHLPRNIMGVIDEFNHMRLFDLLFGTNYRHAAKTREKRVPFSNATLHLLSHPDVSPLFTPDSELATFPKTLVYSVENDILLDEIVNFVQKLRKNNVNVFHKHFQGAFHGIVQMLSGFFPFEMSHMMTRNISFDIRHSL